jgi:hypothetical protein
MAMIQFQERIIENKDWAIALFVLSFALIAVIRSMFETRFNDFLNLLFSDKYIKIYKESSNLKSWFTVVLFIVQVLSFSFFLQLALHTFGYCSKFDYLVFIRIFTFLNVFVLSKFLIEKIIATAFDIEEFVEQFNLSKVSYRTYFGLLLLPINIMLYFNDNLNNRVVLLVCFAIIIINIVIYLKSLKIYQNLVLSNLFYFILYLCTLELGPYYFIYYWFTNR